MGCQNSHQVIEAKSQSAELPKEIDSLISKSQFDEAEKQGDLLFQKGEILKAIYIYQQNIQAHYIHDYDIQGLGNPQHSVGRYQGAVCKWYVEHRQKHNGKGNPYDALSLCYYQGIARYEQMLSQIESYQLYTGYANILANNRKYKEAITVYNKIIGLKPTLLNSYISISLLDQFKIKEAIGMAKKIIGLYPQNMYAQFVLAKNIKDPVAQLESLKALSEKYPDFARSFHIYEHKQDYNEAISWYKKAIYVLPEYAQCYQNIGLNLQALNQKEEAIDWYMKACEKSHQIQSPFLKLVTIFENLQYDQAKIEAEIAKHPNLDKFSFYYELGFAYYENKKIDESLI